MNEGKSVRVRPHVRRPRRREDILVVPKLTTGSADPDDPLRAATIMPGADPEKREKYFDIILKRQEIDLERSAERESREAKKTDLELRKQETELQSLLDSISAKKKTIRFLPGGTVDERRARSEIKLLEAQADQSRATLSSLRQHAKKEKAEAKGAKAIAKQAKVQASIMKEQLKRERLTTSLAEAEAKEKLKAHKQRLEKRAPKKGKRFRLFG